MQISLNWNIIFRNSRYFYLEIRLLSFYIIKLINNVRLYKY